MTKKEITSLIDQIASNRSRIYFSGAEVFSRRDAIDIIEYASNKGIPVALTTNGTLIDDKTSRRLSQLSKLRLNFSIDGPEDVHDKIRGTGNYKKTISTIERIVAYRSNKNSPVITTNTTFSPEILGRTTEMIHHLSRTGVDSISFQHLWFTSENRINYNNQILLRRFKILNDNGPKSHLITTFSADYIDKLSEEVSLLQTKRYEVPVRVNPRLTKDEVVKYYYDLNFTVKKFCDIPWNKILIKANGDALFCPDEWITEFKLGNVREASLLDLWNSEQAKIFRQSMLRDGLLPVCARCCSINMS